MKLNKNSEDLMVQVPALELLSELGWEWKDCFGEDHGPRAELSGRETLDEVVLISRLKPALKKLNRELPTTALDLAVEEISRDRSTLGMVEANHQIYKLLKEGYKASFQNEKGELITETVQYIDWNNPKNNDYFAAKEFWITGRMHKRRNDIVLFVNGVPLVLIELKATHNSVEAAFDDNITDYKETIPQLFWYNACVIISNGRQSGMSSLTGLLEHYGEWKKINSEGEEGRVSLETMLRGICAPDKLLDITENFVLYEAGENGLSKIVAKNHQYLGVNNAVSELTSPTQKSGQLGVFWHTQGSGKSYSMVFFSQKILRTVPGNWTFLVITDRQDLDRQIYQNFARTGVVTEEEQDVRAQNGADLQAKLREDHRVVFTLIQKFQTADGSDYPVLSERSDIIVMTDEAHRTQYDTLALNMRRALPNAKFIGFTGTPLMAGEEKTREVFGEYVSVYDFAESVRDGATVALHYDSRKPELHLDNEQFEDEMQDIIEAADLNADQEHQLERKLGKQYHLITRDDRLEEIAKDIVNHFANRGYLGKGMVISIDRFTAIRMYNKVKLYWQQLIESTEEQRDVATDDVERLEVLQEKLKWMRETDMAVIVSQSQNELKVFREKGLDIETHRRRMVDPAEDLETKFKAPTDPLRLVFVCAMWITGFDAPSVSTIYLDKPLKNHTLMQTIARANRVFAGKISGMIVDYCGILTNLNKALAIYATGQQTGGGMPVLPKTELIEKLRQTLVAVSQQLQTYAENLETIDASSGFERIEMVTAVVDAIVTKEDRKKEFIAGAQFAIKLLKALMPDALAEEFQSRCQLLSAMLNQIKSLDPTVSVEHVMQDINALLDRSIASEGYVIREGEASSVIDLSKIDIKKLQKLFDNRNSKHIALEKLRNMISARLDRLVELNETRTHFRDLFEELLDEYNAGTKNVEEAFKALLELVGQLDGEERRAVSEDLSEEELAIFDILVSKPAPELTKAEVGQVKKVAQELLMELKAKKLVLDWKKNQQTRAMVQVTIRDVLDEELPESYTPEIEEEKQSQIYQHVYERYQTSYKNIYEVKV